MADYRAATATCEGVLHLLRSSYRPDLFELPLDFRVYSTNDFQKPMETGISLFLYRIYINGDPRHPQGGYLPDGRRRRSPLPLDLHFFLTVWAKDASLQYAVAGWMMRILEDTPTLPAGLLNSTWENVFSPEEAVEIMHAELTNEDMFRIWDTLIPNGYRLSIPYLARAVHIDSQYGLHENQPPVTSRETAYHFPSKSEKV